MHRAVTDPHLSIPTATDHPVKNSTLPHRAALRASLSANLSSIGRDVVAVALRVALALALMCALVLWLARGS